jgi:hypothetical protein
MVENPARVLKNRFEAPQRSASSTFAASRLPGGSTTHVMAQALRIRRAPARTEGSWPPLSASFEVKEKQTLERIAHGAPKKDAATLMLRNFKPLAGITSAGPAAHTYAGNSL